MKHTQETCKQELKQILYSEGNILKIVTIYYILRKKK